MYWLHTHADSCINMALNFRCPKFLSNPDVEDADDIKIG